MMRFCYPLCTGLHVYPQFLAQELMVVVTLTVATVFAKVQCNFDIRGLDRQYNYMYDA